MVLAIGIDVVEVDRVQRAAERLGDRFLDRIFTTAERQYCDARGARFVHYAGRFAAKEAAMKALGTGWAEGVAWREVEILSSGVGPPQLALTGAAKARFDEMGATRALVSISHTDALAVAQVLFEGQTR
jgi:holo-[acyl-carrier protein] synthase